MSAPYWGQLPPPKVTRTGSMKRGDPDLQRDGLTIDTNTRGDRLSNQSISRKNRESIQTEAATVSTQSPFASPTASSFRGDGLAPRPSSYQSVPNDAYNKDYLEKRRRREARNNETYDDQPPPAAPDVPRAPPVSYKQPYGNGPVRSRSNSRPEGPISPRAVAPDEYYPDPVRRRSKGKEAVRNGEDQSSQGRRDSEPQVRKGSISEAEAQRRREWAQDRSPLQRLELTLDSITKEEKRARVEEAELLAREAKAGKGGERASQDQNQIQAQNSVRFRNRPVAKAPDPTQVQAEPQTLPDAGLVRNLSNRQKDQLQRSGTVEKKRPLAEDLTSKDGGGFDYEPIDDQGAPPSRKNSVPQRSGSVKDKLAIPLAAGAAAATGISRSGSNKLKKDPPGDPWLHRRQYAEKEFKEVNPRKPSVGGGQPRKPVSSRDKELPSLPKEARAPAYPINTLAPDSDEEVDIGTLPVRRGSTKKIQQLTGENIVPHSTKAIPPSQLYGERTTIARAGSQREPNKEVRTELVTVNGIKYGVTPGNNNQATTRSGEHDHHHFSNILHRGRHDPVSGQGVYTATRRLQEWKKGGVILLDGPMLDLSPADKIEADKDKAWWEAGNTGRRRRSSTTTTGTKQRNAEAYDLEFDDNSVPTRFKPHLFLKAGPFLRYCGLRRERKQGRIPAHMPRPEREVWRGSVMIVTQDSNSSYELAPTLRLFLQPMDLLPPPPVEVAGPVAPEYVDPIAGLPKIGRDGRTLYIRPVEHLEEAKDLSREESDEGLFETHRTPLEGSTESKPTHQKSHYDGEKAGKYKEIRGFRLHAEHGNTFWKFNIEVELRDQQQRIAYRINRGPATGFWVPAKNQAMNIMFYSCNGFSHGIDPDQFSGPDPLWRDVLNTHQTQPFHVMLGGGDQLYNDAVQHETTLFKQWTEIRDPHHKEHEPFTAEMQDELEKFYLNRYAMWFSQGLFGLAVSQIPMVNIFDDHDIIDGFGSYSDRYMRCPVMSGVGAVAFKYYMLFQHQSSIDEGEESEPSWILGAQPGPYIPELSRSIFTFLGRSVAFLGLDCRTERMYDEVVSPETYDKVLARLEKELVKGETKHLIVLLGVPIAYPRMVWLENILTSRLMEPVKALSRAGVLGKGLLNHLDGGVEILDDLDDHWTAKHHKDERNFLIEELQELAAEKSVRITFLGGDVHLAAVGQFYSNPKLGIRKDHDHRYMPNIISSAIANTPPPDALADLLNKRNKIHHLNPETDEDMIPIFTHDVTGKARNNKRLLNRRNWCSIRMYNPDLSPPSTPSEESFIETPPPKRPSILRRLSSSRGKGPTYRPDASASLQDRPPLSSTSFFSRHAHSQSQSNVPQQQSSPTTTGRRPSTDTQRSGSILKRTLSLTRKDFNPTNLFRRASARASAPRRRRDDINGYGSDTETETGTDDDDEYEQRPPPSRRADNTRYTQNQPSAPPQGRTTTRIRGGSGGLEPSLSHDHHNDNDHDHDQDQDIPTRSPRRPSVFHRTPTSLSTSKQKQAQQNPALHAVNLEGGLDITLNVEVSPKDPAGITVPYRLLVPGLWYEERRVGEARERLRGGMGRWIHFVSGSGSGRWRDHGAVGGAEKGGESDRNVLRSGNAGESPGGEGNRRWSAMRGL